MTDRVPPNPYSPYSTAALDVRHLLPVPVFFGDIKPTPGALALAGCGRMTVVPLEPLEEVTDRLQAGRTGELPPGLCAGCVSAATGEGGPLPPVYGTCGDCGLRSSHGVLCALCRQDEHEKWWPTRDQAGTEAGR